MCSFVSIEVFGSHVKRSTGHAHAHTRLTCEGRGVQGRDGARI